MPRALDHRPHPQPERGVAEQQRRAASTDDRRCAMSDRHLVAVERVVAEVVERVLVGAPDRRRCRTSGSAPNHSFTISGIATSRPSDGDELRRSASAVRRYRNRNRSRTKPSSGATTNDREEERRDDRPLVADVERRSRPRPTTNACAPNARLNTPDVLYVRTSPTATQREHAAERDAPDDVADELGHVTGSLGRDRVEARRGRLLVRRRSSAASAGLSGKHTNGLPGLPNTGTNLPSSTFDAARCTSTSWVIVVLAWSSRSAGSGRRRCSR